jgi:hypothetical protein
MTKRAQAGGTARPQLHDVLVQRPSSAPPLTWRTRPVTNEASGCARLPIGTGGAPVYWLEFHAISNRCPSGSVKCPE